MKWVVMGYPDPGNPNQVPVADLIGSMSTAPAAQAQAVSTAPAAHHLRLHLLTPPPTQNNEDLGMNDQATQTQPTINIIVIMIFTPTTQ